jgi:PAS domain-containing protein
VVPNSSEPFLVVDSQLRVQAVSRRAETLLGIDEAVAVNTPVMNLLVPADAEAQGPTSFAAAIANGVPQEEPIHSVVRPWNTFGVRMRVRIAPCGPPRAALLVLEAGAPRLRAV